MNCFMLRNDGSTTIDKHLMRRLVVNRTPSVKRLCSDPAVITDPPIHPVRSELTPAKANNNAVCESHILAFPIEIGKRRTLGVTLG